MKKIFVKDTCDVFRKNNDFIELNDGFVYVLEGNERVVILDRLEDSVAYHFHTDKNEFVFHVHSSYNWRNEDNFMNWIGKFLENIVDFDFLKCYCTLEEIPFDVL